MAAPRTLIHDASNDDRWFLCRGEDPADVFVSHEANRPSGGTASRIELATFLASEQGAPERRALASMIGSLVLAGQSLWSAPNPEPEPGAASAEPSPGEEASAI